MGFMKTFRTKHRRSKPFLMFPDISSSCAAARFRPGSDTVLAACSVRRGLVLPWWGWRVVAAPLAAPLWPASCVCCLGSRYANHLTHGPLDLHSYAWELRSGSSSASAHLPRLEPRGSRWLTAPMLTDRLQSSVHSKSHENGFNSAATERSNKLFWQLITALVSERLIVYRMCR